MLVKYFAAVEVLARSEEESVVPLVAVSEEATHHPSVDLKVTLVRLLHQWNASAPMLVTLSGITMLVRLRQ